MRRRTKPRVVWLPQTNANSFGDATTVYQGFVMPVGGASGAKNVSEFPMVLDNQSSSVFDATSTLADIESSGYRLRRIVGKIWVQYSQTPQVINVPPVQVIVTAGFMVRASNPNTGTSTAKATDIQLVHPGNIDNTGDPWIWRRSWLLGNRLTQGTSVGAAVFPGSNFGPDGGSVADGPHVDQKTARIVGPEERLFLNVGSTVFVESPDLEAVGNLTILTDIRCLGSLRTNAGNRRNASR